jgi:hypothetical protein
VAFYTDDEMIPAERRIVRRLLQQPRMHGVSKYFPATVSLECMRYTPSHGQCPLTDPGQMHLRMYDEVRRAVRIREPASRNPHSLLRLGDDVDAPIVGCEAG